MRCPAFRGSKPPRLPQGTAAPVYRLLFLFVAEDRGAAPRPGGDHRGPRTATRCTSPHSGCGRCPARRAGGPHPTCGSTQKLVLGALGGDGLAAVGLPALGGLFDPDPAPLAGRAAAWRPPAGCRARQPGLAHGDPRPGLGGRQDRPSAAGRLPHTSAPRSSAPSTSPCWNWCPASTPRRGPSTSRTWRATSARPPAPTTPRRVWCPRCLDTALDPVLDEAVNGATDRTTPRRACSR